MISAVLFIPAIYGISDDIDKVSAQIDGADATMLSGETASGAHPALAVTLQCDELPSLVDVARQSDTVLLAIRSAAPDLVELRLQPALTATARFGLVTLRRRTAPPWSLLTDSPSRAFGLPGAVASPWAGRGRPKQATMTITAISNWNTRTKPERAAQQTAVPSGAAATFWSTALIAAEAAGTVTG